MSGTNKFAILSSDPTGETNYIVFGAKATGAIFVLPDDSVQYSVTDAEKTTIGNITATSAINLDNLASLQFDKTASTPSHSEGLVYYDSTNKSLAIFNEESDVTLQVGQEVWIRVYNDTGGLIENGKVCYLSGIFSGFPTVAKAQSNDAGTSLATIGISTHSIETGSYGYITRLGTIRDVNTIGCIPGDILYMSPTSAGDFTNVKPTTPNYIVAIGNCGVVDALLGTVYASISLGGNADDVINFYNGATLESDDITITSNGTTVTLSVEKLGGGDLTIFFDGVPETFDTTPAQTISLTAGTDNIPTRNYIYIPKSTRVLTVSTSGYPTTEQYIPLTDVLVPSATRVQSYGVYKNHNWTDHIVNSNDTGHLGHLNKWIRKQNATYDTGVLPSFSGSGTATVEMSSTEGVILQLHEHTFPAFSSPAPFYVYNDFTTPYNRLTNIASIVADSTGTSLLGGTYAIVIWGVVSEDTTDCKLFFNLPSGNYGALKPDEAREDANGYTDYSIPPEYKGTAFLIHRLVISANVGGTAFTVYSDSSDDLRGLIPNTSAGAVVGIGAGTGDMLASVYDPAGIGEQLVGLTSPQTLTSKTLTSPVLNTSVSGTAFLDEDDMSSNSATKLASQQSIKAYFDTGFGQIVINAQTGTTYPVVAGDNTKLVTMSNTATNVVTIPLSLAVGTHFAVQMINTGVTTVTGATGVTINGVSAGSSAMTQWQTIFFIVTATNTISATGGTFV